MTLYVHYVDPHHSAEFADVFFDGGHYAITSSPQKPVSCVEFIVTCATEEKADYMLSSIERHLRARRVS
jgi:hypothetical protein